jgi:hypothetical protein
VATTLAKRKIGFLAKIGIIHVVSTTLLCASRAASRIQRNAVDIILALRYAPTQGSIEPIIDSSGTHNAQPTILLATAADAITLGAADTTVVGNASTLNAEDHLVGGSGYDTLALYNVGTYDLPGTSLAASKTCGTWKLTGIRL